MRLAVLACALTACTPYAWHKEREVTAFSGTLIESPLAREFCSALMRSEKRGCAVTFTQDGKARCVLVVMPGDAEAVGHESTHCMGYSH